MLYKNIFTHYKIFVRYVKISRILEEFFTVSKEDLEILIADAQAGNQDAYSELLQLYDPMITNLVNGFSNLGNRSDIEDLRQEAIIAFVKSVDTYKQNDKVTFGRYAKTCVKNRLIDVTKNNASSKVQNIIQLDEELLDLEIDEDTPENSVIMRESHEILSNRIADCLSTYENRIWKLYVSEYSALEIAKIVGKDEKSVTNAIYRIRKKLRAELDRK